MELEKLEISELEEVLKSKGLDIKELALEAKMLKTKGESTVEVKNTDGEKEFTLSMTMYPDFVITRKTKQTEQQLVIMPSCESFFIKTIKNGTSTTENLSRATYQKFSSGMEKIKMPEDYWLDSVTSGVKWYDALQELIKMNEKKPIFDMIRKHVFESFEITNLLATYDSYRTRENIDSAVKAYQTVQPIYKEFFNDENCRKFIKMNIAFVKDLIDTFSLEKARIFMTRYQKNYNSLLNDEKGHRYYSRSIGDFVTSSKSEIVNGDAILDSNNLCYSLRPNVPMDFNKFCDYVFLQSRRMGYKHSINTFFIEWNDTLKMQMKLRGKIIDKYPLSLPQAHLCLASDMMDLEVPIDEAKFKDTVNKLKFADCTIDDYIIECPKTKEDIIEEAIQQLNCLVGYLPDYAEGKASLYFMRKKTAPNTSYITIEVTPEGELGQHLKKLNKCCTEEENKVVEKWHKKYFGVSA